MGKDVALHVGRDYQRQRYISRYLEPLGIELHKAQTVPAAKELSRNNHYCLVLAHFDTVGREIFEFCSFIRAGDAHAILIALMEKVRIDIEKQLFGCGINDVVAAKQASASALAIRIKAHLHHNNKPPRPQANIVRLKDTVVDFDNRQVYCNGATHKLRGLILDLLKYFLDNPNHVISRDELMESYFWSDSICSSAEEDGKTFDMAVSKLRKIIEPDPSNPQIIITVRGQGWILAKDVIG